ncbi:MAG: hypothetical protein IPJ41_03675 [Phycisphaerales bacterium]|nr:hypothetical protein [Phycisphaerales bacterium]
MRVQIGIATLAGLWVSGAAWGQCQQGWSDAFPPAFMSGGYGASATLFDDGSGMKLVVSDLSRKGDPDAGLQVWDGSVWTSLSDGQFDLADVQIIGADNDGPSPRLFAVLGDSSSITDVVVREGGVWSGTSFPTESLLQNAGVIEPDPFSDDVYLVGLFRNNGQWTKVYKWDGSDWTALDRDTSGASATSLVWFDDGSGMAMYAGVLTRIDGVPVQGLAKWDGQSWSEVPGCPVSWPTITVHDDGSGPAIWAMDSGWMELAKWDGQTWTTYPLESRSVSYSWRLQSVMLNGSRELVWLDRVGDGAAVWRWDGVDGEKVAEFSGGWANDLIEDNSGLFGGGLIGAGSFIRVEDVAAGSVAAFDGSTWTPLGTGDLGNGAPNVGAIAYVGDEGSGSLGRRAYVAADAAGGEPTEGVATWDGSQWGSIGPASMSLVSVHGFAFGDLGAGARVFAGGSIRPESSGGGAVIAWDGQAWSVVADGIESGSVEAMAFGAVAGGEPMLFVGGGFNVIDGVEYHSVAAIDADGWVALGGGLPGQNARVDPVDAMVIHDDGSGAALYAGGYLDDQVPSLADGVVRWDGASWTRVGDPLGTSNVNVRALCSADLGDGLRLYAGGAFRGLNNDLDNVAVWDGLSWTPLGQGMPDGVQSLTRIETQDGPRLAATTSLYTSGGLAERVYLWDGSMWTALGAVADGGVNGIVQASHEGGALYLGGVFSEVAGVPSAGFARRGCESCVADFDGNGLVDTRDFIAFLNAWASQDSSADIDGNGVIDTRDVVGYLNLWAAGC